MFLFTGENLIHWNEGGSGYCKRQPSKILDAFEVYWGGGQSYRIDYIPGYSLFWQWPQYHISRRMNIAYIPVGMV